MNKINPSNYKVALLAGGDSGEREISLASAEGAKKALTEAGFKLELLDTARREDLGRLITEDFDVAFICLHGKNGEDGTIQGMLEILGIPYTGSGVWSSATAMDKTKAKDVYIKNGIPTPKATRLVRGLPYKISNIVNEVGLPCVVKPATDGSALGVHMVFDEKDLGAAIEETFKIDSLVIVERYVSGKELTVAVIGNDDAYALPVIEIVPINSFYDFESKYAPGGSKHICPAQIGKKETELLQNLAVRAHEVLECKGMSRTDFILDDSGAAWTLETNTIPGMTSTSLLPDAAKVAGISFAELCTELIALALEAK
ncbi:MAG: D-alanine--D-alanine ligase family protein [Eggerthellaceae bacterium]